MKDYKSAIKKAIASSEKKDANRKTIFQELKNLSKDIFQATDGRVEIDYTSESNFSTSSNLSTLLQRNRSPSYSFLLKEAMDFDKTVKTLPETENNFVIYAINKDKIKTKLSDLILDPEGYPCTIYADGNKLVAYDAKGFQSNLYDLISSVRVGDYLRQIL
jgi:hypothetical protein